jgi:hypothetical protein
MKTYDSKLREALAEIEQTLKKFDIAAFVTLHSRTHSEFKFCIEAPTWSNVRFIKDGEAIHLKLHTKSDHAKTEDTVAMLYSIKDLCALGFQMMDKLSTRIEQDAKVEHVSFGGGINNDDRN